MLRHLWKILKDEDGGMSLSQTEKMNESIDLIPSNLTKEEAKKQFDDLTKQFNLKHTFSFDEVYDLAMDRRNERIKKENFRRDIKIFEERLRNHPGSFLPDSPDAFPLKHTFADGMYIRQLTVPPGALTVTKIHKKTHPFFLLKGTISILTEEGVKTFTAPHSGITKAGTKRIIYHHDEVVFTTVHTTNETDLDKIEADVIANDFEEMNKIEEKEKIANILEYVKSNKEVIDV